MTQPKALFLADVIESDLKSAAHHDEAAAELRRLSIENDALGLHLSERMKDLAKVEAHRDALLEALKGMRHKYGEYACSVCDHADAAIKAVEGEHMTTITLPRAVVEQALEAMRCAVPTGKITLYEWDKAMAALRAALAQQAEPVEPVESALQAVAEKIGDQCAVWYGIGARDVEAVLREAARYGLVHGAQAEPAQEPDYWQEEARRYAGNADYWRKRYEALAEPVDTDCHTQGICQRSAHGIPKP